MGTFKTDKSQYFYDTGTSKMFSCDIDEYEILKNLTEIGDLSQLEQTVSGKEKKLALKKIEQYINSEKTLKRSGIMFKIKKILPVFLAILMLIPSVNVLAQEHNMTEEDLKLEELISSIDIDRELNNAINGVIDNEVPKEIIDQIKIKGEFISEESLIRNFSESPEIETGYTVKKLGEIDGESVYSMTAYARPKEIEDKATKLGVTALVGLVWIDNFGIDNELESVFYGWKPTGDSEVSNRELRIYVDNTNRDGIRYPRSNDFTHFSYYRKGFRFSATTTADVTDGRNKGSITVTAETKFYN